MGHLVDTRAVRCTQNELIRPIVVEIDKARIGMQRVRDLGRNLRQNFLKVKRRIDCLDRLGQQPQVSFAHIHPRRRVRFAIVVAAYEWILALHITGAFLLLGGGVLAAIVSLLARGRSKPSEIAALLGIARFAVPLVGLGAIITITLGLCLIARDDEFRFSAAWIILAIVLWVAAMAAGGIGGKADKETRLLAEKLASTGDQPSIELDARLRDTKSLALNWGSGVLVIVILALMVWKPGQ